MIGYGFTLNLLSIPAQAFAIAPFRLLFPYFGVITNLLQCCGLCSELTSHPPATLLHSPCPRASVHLFLL